MELSKRKIVLGVSGGVAAYKAGELVRRLRDEGAWVQVVMTPAARHFIGAATLQALSGNPVFDDLWDTRLPGGMAHIALARGADAILVAPASANFLARIANGLSEDLLSTLVLARRAAQCPLLLAPAMNVEMWEQAATRRNLARLQEDGVIILGPSAGSQACGETGAGRMLEPNEIVEDLVAAFQPQLLTGRRVLITAGPTFEALDPVRGISNRSSGRMGYALARAAREAGATVVLVSGPTALSPPHGVQRIDVQSAAAMLECVLTQVDRVEVFAAVAAVADWRARVVSATKLKKDAAAAPPRLDLIPNPDILATVAARPAAPLCVGFAAETEDLVPRARAKLAAKGVAMIIANEVSATLGAHEAELILVDRHGAQTLPRASKLAQARRIVAAIATRLGPAAAPASSARP